MKGGVEALATIEQVQSSSQITMRSRVLAVVLVAGVLLVGLADGAIQRVFQGYVGIRPGRDCLSLRWRPARDPGAGEPRVLGHAGYRSWLRLLAARGASQRERRRRSRERNRALGTGLAGARDPGPALVPHRATDIARVALGGMARPGRGDRHLRRYCLRRSGGEGRHREHRILRLHRHLLQHLWPRRAACRRCWQPSCRW